MEYDAFELCTPELQAKITPARDRFEALRMKKIEIELVSWTDSHQINWIIDMPCVLEASLITTGICEFLVVSP